MAADPNWARWIFASVADYLKEVADAHQIPTLVEGLDDRTDAYMQSTNRAEVRVNGPYTQEVSQGYFRVWVDVNVLLTSRMDGNKNGYDIQRLAGIFQSAMHDQIPVFNYGNQPGDFVEDLPDSLRHLGCLSPRAGPNDSVKVLHFGQIEKTDRIKQSAVDARYVMYLNSEPVS